jgi:anti-sigma factor (TIGR02949 family)
MPLNMVDHSDHCRSVRGLLVHLRRGELGTDDADRVRAHLAECPDCRRFDEIEASFDRLIAGALAAAPAPEGLQERIRSRLDEAAPVAEGARGLPAWGWALAAAAALIVGLFIPNPARPVGGSGPAEETQTVAQADAVPAAEQTEIRGILVDDECDRAGMPVRYQKDCDHPRHHTVLRTEAGEYVSLVAHAGMPSIGRGQRGRKVLARGVYQASTGTLDLSSVVFQ